jgi:hypothetical protein
MMSTEDPPPAPDRRIPRDASLAGHAALLGIELMALAIFAGPWPVIHGFSIDDAWIHQDVARTFARTGTLGYAPGEFGAGATSYLWAALLSLNYRWFHADPVAYTLAINIALYLGSCHLLLAMALRDGLGTHRVASPRIETAQAVLAVGLAAIGGNFIWFAFSGMEAPLVIFLSFLAIACVSAPLGGGRGPPITAGVATGLLALTRPEAIALGPILALASHRFGRRPRDTAFLVGCWAAAVVAYFGVNVLASGTALPATLGGRKWIWLGDAVGILRAFAVWDFVCAWFVRLRNFSLGTSSDVAMWIALAMAVAGAMRLVTVRSRGLLLVVAWTFIHVAIYMVMLPTLGHGGRYQPLLPPTYLLLVGIGSITLIEDLVWAGERLLRPARHWAWRLVEMASLTPWIALILVGLRDWSHDYAKSVTHIRATEIGLGPLVDALPPDATVASFDIGGIGFASHRPILDLGGLSDPHVADLLRAGTLWTYLRDKRIEYVAIPEEYDPRFPGALNFAYRLHLAANPAIELKLTRALQTPPSIWFPAIRATAGSAPRQALYHVRFTGQPGPEIADGSDASPAIEDTTHTLDLRARATLERSLRAMAAAKMPVRLSLVDAPSTDGSQTPERAWWIQLGAWGIQVDPPRGESRVTEAQLTALFSDRMRPYFDAPDLGAAALLSLHVLVESVQRWIDPKAQAMLVPAMPPGVTTDAKALLDALPVGLPCAVAALLVVWFLERWRKRGATPSLRLFGALRKARPVASSDVA